MPDVDYSGLTPPKVATSSFMFYDIESLQNIFTLVTYDTRDSKLNVFIEIDSSDTTDRITVEQIRNAVVERRFKIAAANPAWIRRARAAGHSELPEIRVHDLSNDFVVDHLDRLIGGTQDNPKVDLHDCTSVITGDPLVCDTNPEYDPKRHPFIAGYNSNQYDTTILAVYLSERFTENGFAPVTAAQMRDHNDSIFDLVRPSDQGQPKVSMPKYLSDHPRARTMRMNWINSGRHVDLARLNELQQRVALKRLLGMLGHQILESDRLSGNNARVDTLDDAIELVTYNISDAVGNALLTEHPVYAGSFDLRSGLLRTYPEVVFDHRPGDLSTPDQNTTRVLKRWPRPRLVVDSSSAQFAGRILAPYRDLKNIHGHVADLPVVSFRYPDPLRRNPDGTPPVNVLSQARDFFFESVPPTTPGGRAAHQAFEQVYRYYRSIEGLSFTSEETPTEPREVLDSARLVVSAIAQHQPDLTVAGQYPGLNGPIWATFTATQVNAGYIRLIGNGAASEKVSFPQEMLAILDLAFALVEAADLHPDDRKRDHAHVLRAKALIQAWIDSDEPYHPDAQRTPFAINYDPSAWRNRIHTLAEVAKPELNMPYYSAEGEPSSGFVTFSYGGIHGAEANKELLTADQRAGQVPWRHFHAAIEAAQSAWARANQRYDDGHPDSKREADGVSAGRIWIPEAVAATAADPDSEHALVRHDRPDGTPYSLDELAIATWWLRKTIRIAIDELDDDGQPVVVQWHHVLKASGTKADNPVMREFPEGLRNAGPRVFINDTKANKEPPLGPPVAQGELVNTANKLDSRYRYTSVADVIHEDFTSYYPLLLVNLAAFANPDLTAPGQPARDKYSEIFADKERYGKLMKDPDLDPATKAQYAVLRSGVKLILNAASGAADARHDTPILMNNMIITMRIIGQIFSWRIGQAQTARGGTIVSTNTDGLYSTLDEQTNNEVLAEHTEAIGVEIEPEPLTLVSKDANNRVEFHTPAESATLRNRAAARGPNPTAFTADDVIANPRLREVVSAGGGTLACWAGPNPTKALAHSAIVDRILVEYFKYTATSVPGTRIDEPADREVMRTIISALHAELPARELLRMYQNLLASSPSAPSYIYAAPVAAIDATDSAMLTFEGDTRQACTTEEMAQGRELSLARNATAVTPRLLGHYTRVFSVATDRITPDLAKLVGEPVILGAAKASTISTVRVQAMAKNGNTQAYNPVAAHLLRTAGLDPALLRNSRAIVLAKHSGVDPTAPVITFNDTLVDHTNDKVITALLHAIDVEAYLDAAVESFDKNWRNVVDPDTQ